MPSPRPIAARASATALSSSAVDGSSSQDAPSRLTIIGSSLGKGLKLTQRAKLPARVAHERSSGQHAPAASNQLQRSLSGQWKPTHAKAIRLDHDDAALAEIDLDCR